MKPDVPVEAVDRWIADVLSCRLLSVRSVEAIVSAGKGLGAHDAQILRLPQRDGTLRSRNQDGSGAASHGKRPPRWSGRWRIADAIASPCVDAKDGAWQVICPVDATFADDGLPAHEQRCRAINARSFGDSVTGWGASGGASETNRTRSRPRRGRRLPPPRGGGVV